MMDILKKYVDKFNKNDEEIYINKIDNNHAYEWLREEIPIFECPDKDIEETYYFRWWTYRKHIKETDFGFMISEFLPTVPWSGKYNEIVAAAGHHLCEGRWLKNSKLYLKDYINYFLDNSKSGHNYSIWLIYAIHQMCLVTDDWDMGENFLEKICNYYTEWEKQHLLKNNMFWSVDDRDAMEYSVSGTTKDLRPLKGIRPTLNSYMCADAWAIAEFAKRLNNKEIAEKYTKKYESLKNNINENLWQSGFYRAFHFEDENIGNSAKDIIENCHIDSPKELIGYIPWMFGIPENGKESVFKFLTDENCFYTNFGLTTVEKTNRRFLYEVNHECLWNGYIWPFAISQTLTAMRNMIFNYPDGKKYMSDFCKLIKQYAKIHKRITDDGKTINWIDEVKHPLRDEWSSREILKNWGWKEETGGYERGKDYNHSTFCDLIISGIAGIKYENDIFTVSPIIPDEWDYFKLENLHIKGKTYSVYYDKSGEKYNLGTGLIIK
ncbi:MAG: hypothetical protein J6A69_11870 [Clostridia bacterium]|nr:hypothetical protein [Clostridia bacterium]